MTTKEERANHWRTIHAKQAESGLSAAAFCRENNISYHQFCWWKGRFKKEESRATQETGFLQLVPCSKKAPQHSGIHIRLGDDFIIEIERGFDIHTLQDVIEAVGNREAKSCSR